MNIFEELSSLIGSIPYGMEWLVYLVACCLVVLVFSNGLRVIAYVLGLGSRR